MNPLTEMRRSTAMSRPSVRTRQHIWRSGVQIAFALVALGGCGEELGDGRDGSTELDASVVDDDATVPVGDGGPAADLGGEVDATVPSPVCGDGVIDGDEECDDGNTSPEDECSADCRRTYACPALPIDCDGATASTSEHHLAVLEPCSFALLAPDPAAVAERRALIDALVDRSAGRRSIADVLGDLNRQGRAGIGDDNAYRLRNHELRGFRWNTGDENVAYWYPQGITSSSDGFESGVVEGRRALMVSWYHKTDARPTKGVRLSLADISDLGDVDYRHLLLVEPTGTPESPDFAPVESGSGNALHAGGIVWWGEQLYVADTGGGIRVFDLAHIMRVPDVDDTDRIGLAGGRFDAHGYRYAIPELMRYRRAGCSVRFSFLALDRSSTPPALVSGEYRTPEIDGRIVVWDLDPATGLPDVRSGEVRASAAYVGGQSRMQGAVRYEGNFYISSSSQYERWGRLYRTRPGFGESSITAWVYGAEDLTIDRASDTIWTPAEHPGDRDTVGIPIRRP
jgi:cysteine-rich repeat protein